MSLENYQGSEIVINSRPEYFPHYFGEQTNRIPYINYPKIVLADFGMNFIHRLTDTTLWVVQKLSPKFLDAFESELCIAPEDFVANLAYLSMEIHQLRQINKDFRQGRITGIRTLLK